MKYCMAIGVLLVFFGCKTQKTELKDAVTVSKSGQTLFIAAKDDKIIVRSCPANSVPSGTSSSELPALIERNCPSTGSNEKTFARNAVLSFIQDFYARSYIPAGEPMDEELKRLKEQGRSEAEAKKIASLTLRSMISTRVFEIETELKAMNDYYNRNADDVTSEIKAQLLSRLTHQT